MSELSDFLLARYAEDEEVAREAAGRSSYGWSDNAFTEAVELAENEGAREVAMRHIARHDPARVLAECKAKRQVIGLLDGYTDQDVEYWALHEVLQVLALPYADHPDYRSEWRP